MPELTMEQMTATMRARQAELSDTLDKLQREVAEAMAPLEAENQRISRALAALDGAPAQQRRSRGAGRPRGSGKRADEALAIVKKNPGATTTEIAKQMGVKPNYLYRVLPTLADAGKVEKRGQGWHAK